MTIDTAVILSAGVGSRLGRVTRTTPKGLLCIGEGISIVEESILKLKGCGLRKIIIGTGFLHAEYVAALSRYDEVIFVRNDRFLETGSMFTLYNLRHSVKGDFLLLESDLIYEKRALHSLLDDDWNAGAILGSGLTGSGDEVFIEVDGNGKLMNLSKKSLDLGSIYAELTGISRISLDSFGSMCRFAESSFATNPGLDYEYAMLGVANDVKWHVKKVSDLIWCEIDNSEHLIRAHQVIYPRVLIADSLPTIRRNVLLTPGPATTTDSVKLSQIVEDICPREREFGQVMEAVSLGICKLAQADPKEYSTVLFGGSGTAAVEATICSAVPAGGQIAAIINGAYGQRMADIARTYHIPCVEVAFEWGARIELEAVRRVLNEDPTITTVAAVHHETTTGMLNPVREIGILAKEFNCTYVVDAVSSFAGIPFAVSDICADYAISTSNKCVQGMAGVAFVISRIEALERMHDYPRRSYYLSLYDQYRFQSECGQTRFTPPVQVLYALRQAIRECQIEGVDKRYARYSRCWRRLRSGMEHLGFRMLLDEADESHLLITIFEPDVAGFSFEEMHNFLYKRGFTVYPGKIGNQKTFRVATIGAIDVPDIDSFLAVLREYLVCASNV